MTGGVESEQLWVGLGNPGKDYEQTRHNIGFMALTAIAEAHGFTPFKNNKKLFAEVAEGKLGTSRVRALLPQTYMNDSGKAVAAAARFWGYAPEAILVIHDELDLVAGKIRLKHGGGDAGHNGLRSITASLSSCQLSPPAYRHWCTPTQAGYRRRRCRDDSATPPHGAGICFVSFFAS